MKKELEKILKKIKVPKKSVILLTGCFLNPPQKNLSSSKLKLNKICNEIRQSFGNQATVVSHAFTPEHGYFKEPFNYDSKKASCGYFSNWLLNKKKSKRSLHPLHSVVAHGPDAKKICFHPQIINYGIGSPFDAICKNENSFIVRLNIDPYFNAIVHHAEATFGVPYKYKKVLSCKILKHKKILKTNIYASVRYKNLKIEYCQNKLKTILKQKKIVKHFKCSFGSIAIIHCKSYFQILQKELEKDPFFLLRRPPFFKNGHLPKDGLARQKEI